MFFCFVTKHACDGQTDGETDGQNYDPQDRVSIAASRGKNRGIPFNFVVNFNLQTVEERTGLMISKKTHVIDARG